MKNFICFLRVHFNLGGDFMKKFILIMLALLLTFSVAACGGKDKTPAESGNSSVPASEAASPVETASEATPVNLVEVTTELNVTLLLPDSMEKQNEYMYADIAKGESAFIIADMADPSMPLSDWDKDEFTGFILADYDDLVVASYDNDLTLNGNKALVCKFSFTSDEGNSVAGAIVYVTYKNAEYRITLMYPGDDANGALAKNIQTIIDSISISY